MKLIGLENSQKTCFIALQGQRYKNEQSDLPVLMTTALIQLLQLKRKKAMNQSHLPFWYQTPFYLPLSMYQHQFYTPACPSQPSPILNAQMTIPDMEEPQVQTSKQNIIISEEVQEEKEAKKSGMPKSLRKRVSQKKKDENFGWRKQNAHRNLLSDILKKYINLTLTCPEMEALTRRVIQKLGFESGVSDFRKFVIRKFPGEKSYIGLNLAKKVVKSSEESSELTQLFRITLRNYLREVYPLLVISDPQLSTNQKKTYLDKAKSLSYMIFKK